jgi:predicted peroxiredoxin
MKMQDATVIIGICAIDTVPLSFLHAYANLKKPAKYGLSSTDKKPLDAARNFLAEKLPDDADYLLFLDSDTLPPSDAIEKLLAHDKPIVGGLYFMRMPPFWPLMMKRDAATGLYAAIKDWPENSLVEVDSTGLGCLLIKREVFEKIEKPWFKFEPPLSEDFYFCRRARDAGYKIFVDTSVKCEHLGTFSVNHEFYMRNVKNNPQFR